MTLIAGALVCACSSGGGTTGVLEGTAPPCTAARLSNAPHAWEVVVLLRRGSTVVARRTVLDTENTDDPQIDDVFRFSEPAGTYSVSGAAPTEQPVVIRAGATSTVQLTADCR